MNKLSFLIGVSLLICMSTYSVNAQTRSCYRDGKWYSHGTKVGNYICRDGKWVKIQAYRDSTESLVSEDVDPFKALLMKFRLPNWFINK